MARRELGPASLAVAQAVATVLPAGPVVVGVSGGADSLALTLGAQWAAPRCDATLTCIVVDHGLQAGSAEVAARTVEQLRQRGLAAEATTVHVAHQPGDSLEAAARDARLAVLAAPGAPVLLGHTLDDQAESVLLGLLRGSGTRAVAGMATVRGPFIRPLLGLRRDQTRQACREWGIEPWEDPHNADPRFARVNVRSHLTDLNEALGRDVAPALARTAALARTDADFLDQLARDAVGDDALGPDLQVSAVKDLPDALRLRVLRTWLAAGGLDDISLAQVQGIDDLVRHWRGQGPVDVPGGRIARRDDALHRLV